MKKLLLTTLAIASAGLMSMAQITINANDVADLGDTIITYEDTIAGVTIQAPGTGLTWDFSALMKHDTNGVILEHPDSSFAGSLFPNATMVVREDDSTHIFIYKDLTILSLVGFAELQNNGDTALIQGDAPFLAFPSSHGTNTVGNLSLGRLSQAVGFDPDGPGPHPFVDSAGLTIDLRFATEIDAEGVATMPQGDFDVLRQKAYEIQIDTAWMYANGMWQFPTPTVLTIMQGAGIADDTVTMDTTNIEVRFWTDDPGISFYMVQFDQDSTGTVSEDWVEWMDAVPTPKSGILESKVVKNIYPIPSQTYFVITLDEGKKARYELLTIDGRTVQAGDLNQMINTIDISSVSTGTYVLKLADEENIEIRKVAIE